MRESVERKATNVRRDGGHEGALGLCQGLDVLARDVAVVQHQREAHGSLRGQNRADHPLQGRTQGDHLGARAFIAAGGEGTPLLFIDHQGQGELAQGPARLRVFSSLRQAGPRGNGRDTRVIVGGVREETPLSQREALRELAQQGPLERRNRRFLAQVPLIPEALAAHLL